MRLITTAVMFAILLSLITVSISSTPGHPGGFYADVIAIGYGVKILNVDEDSHLSPDKLSAVTKLVGDTRDFYTINYTLKTKGLNVITVRAPEGVEIAFKSEKRIAEIDLKDDIDPALQTTAEYEYSPGGNVVSEHENTSYVANFKVYASSSGNYGYTQPIWTHTTKSPPKNATSYSTFSKVLIDNDTYIGWRINLTSNVSYTNTTSGVEIQAHSIMNSTILVSKRGDEVILLVRGFVRVYNPNGEEEKDAEIKVLVNTSGVYAWRNGTLKYHNTSTTVYVKDITGIWDGSKGYVVSASIDGNIRAEAWVEIGDVTIKVYREAPVGIKYVKPGVWAFKADGRCELTMYIYPHPIASGYNRIFVQFTRQ